MTGVFKQEREERHDTVSACLTERDTETEIMVEKMCVCDRQ